MFSAQLFWSESLVVVLHCVFINMNRSEPPPCCAISPYLVQYLILQLLFKKTPSIFVINFIKYPVGAKLRFISRILQEKLCFNQNLTSQKFNLPKLPKEKKIRNNCMHVVTVFLLKQFVEYHILTFLNKTFITS